MSEHENIENNQADDNTLMSYEDSQLEKKLKESKSINIKELKDATDSVEKRIAVVEKRKEKKVMRRDRKNAEAARVQKLTDDFEEAKKNLEKANKKITKLNKSIYTKNLALLAKNQEIAALRTRLAQAGITFDFSIAKVETASESDS